MIIGYKMRQQMGFEIFKNQNGDITIEQVDPYQAEKITIALSKAEAKALRDMLDEMIEIAEEPIEQIKI